MIERQTCKQGQRQWKRQTERGIEEEGKKTKTRRGKEGEKENDNSCLSASTKWIPLNIHDYHKLRVINRNSSNHPKQRNTLCFRRPAFLLIFFFFAKLTSIRRFHSKLMDNTLAKTSLSHTHSLPRLSRVFNYTTPLAGSLGRISYVGAVVK